MRKYLYRNCLYRSMFNKEISVFQILKKILDIYTKEENLLLLEHLYTNIKRSIIHNNRNGMLIWISTKEQYIECGIFIQWDLFWPYNSIKCQCMLQHGWTLKTNYTKRRRKYKGPSVNCYSTYINSTEQSEAKKQRTFAAVRGRYDKAMTWPVVQFLFRIIETSKGGIWRILQIH